MRRVRAVVAAFLAAAVVARCASPGIPPGGPPDEAPPQLVRMTPDSNATNARDREIDLEFNEVVAEVPTGANAATALTSGGGGSSRGPTLASIMILSPRSGALSADWHRERVTVRPRNGFRANTTYTLTILPGLADLRNNVRDSAIVSVFSTGPNIAHNHVSGIVFDWVTGRVAQRALVEAMTADSVTYLAVADTGGRFTVPNVPPGVYRVRGIVDANNNRDFDPREAYAVAEVAAADTPLPDTGGVELLAFVHDTLGPRVVTVTQRDSVTLRLTFDRPLDPAQPIEASRFRVQMRDSSEVPIAAAYTATLYDSVVARRQRASADSAARADTSAAARAARAQRDSTARADSVRRDSVARRDSTARRTQERKPRTPSKPSPSTDVVIVLAQPLKASSSFRVTASGMRSVSGTTQPSSERTFTTPKPVPIDSSRRALPDSARRTPADTARKRPSS